MPRVIVAGNNWLCCRVLDLCLAKGDLVGIFVEDRDSGWDTSFRKYVENLGIKVPTFFGSINSKVVEVESLKPDIMLIQRAYSLIKPPVLNAPRFGCTNVHFGPLPLYGGCHTISWALRNGEKQVGVTLHFMNEKFDKGPIIDQRLVQVKTRKRTVRIFDKEFEIVGLSAGEVYPLVNQAGLEMMDLHYDDLVVGRAITRPQGLGPKSYYPKTSISFDKDKCFYPAKMTAEEITNHILAFTFPQTGQYPIAIGEHGEAEIIKLEEGAI